MYNTAYDTMYGKLNYIDEVKNTLAKYFNNGFDLSFGYKTGTNCNLAFITGINEIEKSIPTLEYPLYLHKANGNGTLVLDVRPYCMAKIDALPSNIHDIIKIKELNLFKYTLDRGYITSDYIAGKNGFYYPLYKYVSSAYAMVISTCCKKLAYLSALDTLNIEVAAAYYYTIKSSPEEEIGETKRNMVTRLSNVIYSIPAVTYDILNNIIKELNEVKVEEYNFTTLVQYLITILHDESKSKYIFPKSLGQQITSMWYGIGGGTNLLISMDDVAGFLAILGLGINDVNLKRSKLISTLMGNKKFKLKDFISDYNKLLSNRIELKASTGPVVNKIPSMSKVLPPEELKELEEEKPTPKATPPKPIVNRPVVVPTEPVTPKPTINKPVRIDITPSKPNVSNVNIKTGGNYEW
jgi:hypothetical protein